MDKVNDIKLYLRGLNIDLITTNHALSIDIKRRYNKKFRLFYPSRKLIDFIIKSGGVLTGSRALRCYKLKGENLLNRSVSDWDFIITIEQAFKICAEMKIDEIPEIDNVISIKNQKRWVHSSYSDSRRVGPVDVQLIIRDCLPDYTEVESIRVASLGYNLNSKVKMIKELEEKISQMSNGHLYNGSKNEFIKHFKDLKEIIIRYNNIIMNK